MPVASATHAPSRSSSPSSMAGCQHSGGIRSTMAWTRSSMGNPKENSTPRLRQAAANRWVAPAESERASTRGESGSPGRGRACSGTCARAMSSTVT